MPPRTRGNKTTKDLKENIVIVDKTKSKQNTKVTKPRKALADKTNSVSDDNASPKIGKVNTITLNKVKGTLDTIERPRRERRVPKRYVESQIPGISSPNNVTSTSTPKKDAAKTTLRSKNNIKRNSSDKTTSFKETKKIQVSYKNSPQKKPVTVSPCKLTSDTNNNAKKRFFKTEEKSTKSKLPKYVPPQKSPKKVSPKKSPKKVSHKQMQTKMGISSGKKLLENSFSFIVLDEKKKSTKRNSNHLDVYEFTYDPNEEPPPQKKKRKKVVRKKPAQPKTVVFKNNYDKNVAKALAALKSVVGPKTKAITAAEKPVAKEQNTIIKQPVVTATTNKTAVTAVTNNPVASNIVQETVQNNTTEKTTENRNHVSVRIEDIGVDFEPPLDHHNIDYSPVTSPNRAKTPNPISATRDPSVERQITSHDPLNLKDDISFFDDVPIASSSMNVSVRRPDASPWRVDFNQLPIKWQVNTYVKPNMTPALESSFINLDENKNKKRHVYTNLVPQSNDALPEIVEKDQSNMKQTSIIDFIREVAQRSASKKKRARSVTPTKSNSVFDVSNTSVATYKDVFRTPNKTPRREAPNNFSTPNREGNVPNYFNSNSEDKENSMVKSKKKPKSPTKSAEKDCTFFGFDEIEDQENVSPLKQIDNPRVLALRPHARAVLQEINAQTGPARAKLPLAAKTKIGPSSETVNKVYDGMKSATDAPVFPEKNIENVETTNVAQLSDDEDSNSVHLFEDIDVVHHVKPCRKSYGKAKKVTIRVPSTSDSESQILADVARESGSSDEDDLADLTFTLPNMEKKKPKKKAKNKKKDLSKKEKAEVEAWAAGFNSMCEDIEEFPLVVE